MSEATRNLFDTIDEEELNRSGERDLAYKIGDYTNPMGKVAVGSVVSAVHGSATLGNTLKEVARETEVDEKLNRVLGSSMQTAFGFDVEDYFHEDTDVPIDATPYESLSRLGLELSEGEKTASDIVALVGTSMSAINKLNSLPSIAKLTNSPSWVARNLTNMGVDVAGTVGASALVSDETEGSLVDFIPEANRPEFLDWLMDEEGDTGLERRTKNLVEDIFVGLPFNVAFSMFDLLSKVKKGVHGGKTRADKLNRAIEVVADGRADKMREFVDNKTASASIVPDVPLNAPDTGMMSSSKHAVGNTSEISRLEAQLKKEPLQHKRDKLAKKITRAKHLAKSDTARYYDSMPEEAMLDTVAKSNPQIKTKKDLSDMKASQATLKETIIQEVGDFSKAVELNPLLKDQKGAEELLRRFKDKTPKNAQTRNSVKMTSTGDEAIDGAVSVMEQLAKAEGFKKSKISVADQMNHINKTLKDNPTGELANEFRSFITKHGIDEDALIATMSTVKAQSEALPVMIRSINYMRSKRLVEWKKLATELDGVAELSADQIAQFLKVGTKMNALDQSLQGTLSNLGRSLQAQGRAGRDSFGQLLQDTMTDIDPKDLIKTKSNSVFNDMINNIDPADALELKKLISKISRTPANELTAKAIDKAMDGPRFHDLILGHAVGGMISRLSTVAGALTGGLTHGIYKNVVLRNLESLPSMFHGGGINPFTENMERAVALFDVLGDYLKMFTSMGKNKILKSVGLDSADYTNALTHLTNKQLSDVIDGAVKRTADEGRTKAHFVQKMLSIPLGISMQTVNYGVRGMEAADGLIRRMGIQLEARTLANRLWYKEGGNKMYNQSMTRHQFVDRVAEDTNDYLILLEKHRAGKLDDDALAEASSKILGESDVVKGHIDHIARDANQEALETTLQESTEGTLAGDAFQWLGNKSKDSVAGKYALGLTFPFKKTPINFVRGAIEHSPFAFVGKRWRDRMFGDDLNDKIKATAQIMSGFGLMGGGLYLAGQGRLTGSMRTEEWTETHGRGAKPNSVLIGDTWYDHTKWGVISPALTAMADYMNMKSDTDTPQDVHWTNMGLLFTQATLDSSHLAIIQDVMETIQDPNSSEATGKLLVDKLTMLAKPAQGVAGTYQDLMGDNVNYESVIDKESADGLEYFQMLLMNSYKSYQQGWGATLGLEPKVDIFGEESSRYGNTRADWLLNLIGQKTDTAQISRAKNALFNHGLIPSIDKATNVEGVPMTKAQYKKYKATLWQGEEGLLTQMENMVTGSAWASMNQGQQKRTLESMMTKRKNLIKSRIASLDPKFKQTREADVTDKFVKESKTKDTRGLTALEEYRGVQPTEVQRKERLQEAGASVLESLDID